jgi:hypothetical protein
MSAENMSDTAAPDVITFVDEAGARGYVRNLGPASDASISVLCALPVPAQHLDLVRAEFQPLFQRFCDAAPAGEKFHITDAFKPGNEQWGAVAVEVRREMFALMVQRQLRVVYVARRLGIARSMHELHEGIRTDAKAKAASTGTKTYAVANANRPSQDQVDDQLMIDLTLMLDGFMEIAGFKMTDLHFDEIDAPVGRRYMEKIEQTRNIGSSTRDVKARNLVTGEDEVRSISFSAHADFELNTKRVGSIHIVGKADPLIFAVDVVANSVWRHLIALPHDADLNHASSVAGWVLEPITFYDRSGGKSLMDII